MYFKKALNVLKEDNETLIKNLIGKEGKKYAKMEKELEKIEEKVKEEKGKLNLVKVFIDKLDGDSKYEEDVD